MADNSKKVQVFSSVSSAMKALRRPGPYRVTRGDLAGAGVAGQIFVPVGVTGAPLLVFGHDWLTSSKKYVGLAQHVASWGVVVALPSGHAGVLPNGREFAADLVAAAAGVVSATLGSGVTTVDAGRVVLAGHGVGASCAVLAAASGQVKGLVGVAALFPASMTPAAESEEVVSAVRVPGLIVSTPVGLAPGATVAQRMGARWRPELMWLQMGQVSHRVAAETGVLDFVLGLGGLSTRRRTDVWAAVTGWVLAVAAKDRRFAVLVEQDGLGQAAGFERKSGAQLAAALPERLGVDEILESAQKALRKPGKVATVLNKVKKLKKGKGKGKK